MLSPRVHDMPMLGLGMSIGARATSASPVARIASLTYRRWWPTHRHEHGRHYS
jgi:hypothetical protein